MYVLTLIFLINGEVLINEEGRNFFYNIKIHVEGVKFLNIK